LSAVCRRHFAVVADLRLFAALVHRGGSPRAVSKTFIEFLRTETRHLDQAELLRREPTLSTPQGPSITFGGREVVNLASGDYLGLSNHPEVKKAAEGALRSHGVGLASPRMITGTLSLHAELERAIADWLGT